MRFRIAKELATEDFFIQTISQMMIIN